jgi:hypothetical protein
MFKKYKTKLEQTDIACVLLVSPKVIVAMCFANTK